MTIKLQYTKAPAGDRWYYLKIAGRRQAVWFGDDSDATQQAAREEAKRRLLAADPDADVDFVDTVEWAWNGAERDDLVPQVA